MNAWTTTFSFGQFVLDFGLVSGLLLLGTLGRRYIVFFQRYLIPNSLIAGFLGLLLGPELLSWLDFSLERMGIYVYHLLALTFIGVGLYGGNNRRTHGAINLGFIQVMSMLLQAMVGLLVALFIVYLLNPELVPAVGMLLPLGFAMGPGIALTIGQSWNAYGFQEAGSIGLTVAAIGFLFAYFTGILIVNHGIRKGNTALVENTADLNKEMRTGIVDSDNPGIGARLTFFGGAIEPLTFHLALIGAIYLVTYGLTHTASLGMIAIGLEQEVSTLWSFHFLWANLLTLGVRALMNWRGISFVIDEGFVHRITGLFADLLIVTSIMAISLSIAWAYVLPIAAMCLLGSAATYFSTRWTSQRVFQDYHFERFVGIYAQMTGTISSGMALIRVTDPEYNTPVAQDLVLSSGMALAFGFPLLLVINLPFTLFNGQLHGYWSILGILGLYLVFILLLWRRFGLQMKKRASF